jgi:hypothetical protein
MVQPAHLFGAQRCAVVLTLVRDLLVDWPVARDIAILTRLIPNLGLKIWRTKGIANRFFKSRKLASDKSSTWQYN